jgi:hypothetical protein
LAQRFGLQEQIWLDDRLGQEHSRSAPAYAVSQLAAENLQV